MRWGNILGAPASLPGRTLCYTPGDSHQISMTMTIRPYLLTASSLTDGPRFSLCTRLFSRGSWVPTVQCALFIAVVLHTNPTPALCRSLGVNWGWAIPIKYIVYSRRFRRGLIRLDTISIWRISYPIRQSDLTNTTVVLSTHRFSTVTVPVLFMSFDLLIFNFSSS